MKLCNLLFIFVYYCFHHNLTCFISTSSNFICNFSYQTKSCQPLLTTNIFHFNSKCFSSGSIIINIILQFYEMAYCKPFIRLDECSFHVIFTYFSLQPLRLKLKIKFQKHIIIKNISLNINFTMLLRMQQADKKERNVRSQYYYSMSKNGFKIYDQETISRYY